MIFAETSPMRPDNNSARSDPFSFYAIASTSLLESAVPEYVTNLGLLFDGDTPVEKWLRNNWIAEEMQHGDHARRFIEDVWPEFRWQSAFAEYCVRIPRNTTEHLRKTPALEALARCVTETHATMMYRCVSRYVQDERLSKLFLSLSQDEVRHYRRFRQIFESHDLAERNSLWSKIRTIVGRSELAGGRDLWIAFSSLGKHWEAPVPFHQYSYDEFLQKLKFVVEQHYPVEPAVRMLLRPLGKRTFFIRTLRRALQKYIQTGLAARRMTVR